MKKRMARALSLLLCGAVSFSTISATMAACKDEEEKDSIVIMTEELSGLFNPFYATAGADMDVVGMTQIGMLSTDREGNPVAGDNESTVVKDFKYEIVGQGEEKETIYTFVLKNGLKFSDGKPLTMNDVMFNMYEYLDPVYTGSSTMYSIKIKGLSQYRLQSTDENTSTLLAESAAGLATTRILELIDMYKANGKVQGTQDSYRMSEAQVMAAIDNWSVTPGYMDAVSTYAEQETLTQADYRAMLKADYKDTLKTFKEELESDFKAAKESFDTTTAPYNAWKEKLSNDVFKFFLYEGYIHPIYAKDNKGKDILTEITGWHETELQYVTLYPTMEKAIEKVYKDNAESGLIGILTQWGTAGTLETKYTAKATDVLLHNQLGDSDELLYPNIEGIVSLGHTTSETSVQIGDKTYDVAREHNADGTPKGEGKYDVLQITVDGTDPKAIYSFAFTVAPAHYYMILYRISGCLQSRVGCLRWCRMVLRLDISGCQC